MPFNRVRTRDQLCFERGAQAASKGDHEYASVMFAISVSSCPQNRIYASSLLTSLLAAYQPPGLIRRLFCRLRTLQLRLLLLLNSRSGAVACAVSLLKADVKRISTLLQMSQICVSFETAEGYLAGLEYLRSGLRNEPVSLPLNLAAADCFSRLQMYDEAIQCWLAVATHRPNSDDVRRAIHDLQALQAIQRGKYGDSSEPSDR